jgi:hypothetical protein
MTKTTLTLNALEDRAVPAVIGVVKGGPQPEPSTVIGKVAIVKVEPVAPVVAAGDKAGMLLPALRPAVAGMLLPALKPPAAGAEVAVGPGDKVKWAPVPPFAAPATKAGIVMPPQEMVGIVMPPQESAAAPNGILFPVFVDR